MLISSEQLVEAYLSIGFSQIPDPEQYAFERNEEISFHSTFKGKAALKFILDDASWDPKVAGELREAITVILREESEC